MRSTFFFDLSRFKKGQRASSVFGRSLAKNDTPVDFRFADRREKAISLVRSVTSVQETTGLRFSRYRLNSKNGRLCGSTLPEINHQAHMVRGSYPCLQTQRSSVSYELSRLASAETDEDGQILLHKTKIKRSKRSRKRQPTIIQILSSLTKNV